MAANHDILPHMKLSQWESLALESLPSEYGSFYKGAGGDELTAGNNSRALDRIAINPDYLSKSCRAIDMTTRLLGCNVAAPIGLSPTAFHKFAHPDGELATSTGAARAGCPMIVSCFSHTAIRQLVHNGATVWSNIYMWDSRSLTEAAVRYAEEAGARAIVVTCDIQQLAAKNSSLNMENALAMPLPNLLGYPPAEAKGGSAASTWADFRWICQLTKLPVVAKGILNGPNALQAVECGAAAVLVSNHGGRQLDHVPASIDVLPEVVAAVGNRAEVYVDSGFRSGYHVFKALALGARAVFVGRPQLWGLAVAGADGVAQVLDTLKAELQHVMVNAGTPTLADITPNHVRLPYNFYGASKL